ncbi:PREDICTED: keratin, type I cytoskeletal 9-like [Dinoponera quadriceps]|uniref:Keratin, type I cytoskeletal 9-like n=1 Tax=Dinoponera quadriceps TaxID=609295 RepID=A0A6P3Y1E7_DINQU|nr:PREDICTED: keratin, type I cytoskeletal 9-like [Dinoponera quadriceps]
MRRVLLLIAVLSVISLRETSGKPTEIATSSDTLIPDPVALTGSSNLSGTDTMRKQRSPQYGLLSDYGDYDGDSDYDDSSRHFLSGHKRKFHKPHKPFGLIGGHGCRGYDCGGYGGHHQGGQGGSFATASAGSVGGGEGPYGGGHSEANAQSASFSFGPYSATFSVAQSSSGRRGL